MSATAVASRSTWFIDSLATVRVRGEATDGRLAVVEMLSPQGHMPPLHVHRADDETFVVLEGEVTLYAGSEIRTLRAGDVALGPKNVPHTFRVESETARMLVASAPAGFEHFVEAVGEPAAEESLPATPTLPDPDRFAEICREFDIELLGPPGALPS